MAQRLTYTFQEFTWTPYMSHDYQSAALRGTMALRPGYTWQQQADYLGVDLAQIVETDHAAALMDELHDQANLEDCVRTSAQLAQWYFPLLAGAEVAPHEEVSIAYQSELLGAAGGYY